MQHLLAVMEEGAEMAGVTYTRVPGRPLLHIHAEGETGFFNCVGEAMEEQHAIVFCTCMAKVPPHRRLAAAEYLTRGNFGLVVGTLEMDLYDGTVRCKTSMVADGAPPAPEHIATLIVANLRIADCYYAGLLAVVYGDVSPGDAIDAGEVFSLEAVLGEANDRM
jgi:hypothetical protein